MVAEVDLRNSLDVLQKHPILLLPDFVLLAVSYLLLFVLYWYTGLGEILSLIQSETLIDEVALAEFVTTYLTEYFTELVISFATFAFVTFFLGVGVAVFKYSMIRQVLSKKKASLRVAWREKKHYFWDVVLLRVVVSLLSLLAFLLVFSVATLLFLILNPLLQLELAISIVTIFALVLLILSLFFVKMGLFFRYPVMFLKQVRSPVEIVRRSFRIFRKNPYYVILTWVIIFAIGLFSSVVVWFFAAFFGAFISAAIVLTILLTVVNVFVSLIVDLWGDVFLFKRLD